MHGKPFPVWGSHNTDRKRGEVNDYKVGDLVMLSTKDLSTKWLGGEQKS